MYLKTPGHQEYVNHCGWATIELCERVQQQMGREAQPSTAIIGSQSVKTTGKGSRMVSQNCRSRTHWFDKPLVWIQNGETQRQKTD